MSQRTSLMPRPVRIEMQGWSTLTEAEERIDSVTAELRFDIGLLADRVTRAVDWTSTHDALAPLLVAAPTLLVVGSRNETVLEFYRQAMARMSCVRALEIVPGASHLFEEAGTLDDVARLAVDWYFEHLPAPSQQNAGRRAFSPTRR